MDIMELGAIGEFVSGLAVIGSLVYVGLQLRQTNQRAQDAAALEVTNQYDRIFEMMIANPKAREVYGIATGGAKYLNLANPAGFSDDDLEVYANLMARLFHQFENHFWSWRSGTLDEGTWSKVVPYLRTQLESAAGLDYWQAARQGWHGEGFTRYVDEEARRLQLVEA